MNPLREKDALALQFGTEAAFGLYFVTSSGERLTPEQLEQRYAEQGAAMEDTESFLADGGSGVCCTDYAAFIFKALPTRVRIFGFANQDNPDCGIVQQGLHPGGHDFAIVDDRYLVDPWCAFVAGVDWQIVYDLRHPTDLALAALRYGPQSRWTAMVRAEEFAAEQQRQLNKQAA